MHNAQYFIDKFTSIPEEKWCINHFHQNIITKKKVPIKFFGIAIGYKEVEEVGDHAYCAQGHCMGPEVVTYFSTAKKYATRNEIAESYPEWHALIRLFDTKLGIDVGEVNNGMSKKYQQPTAKKRILKALQDIRELESPSPDTIIAKALVSTEA